MSERISASRRELPDWLTVVLLVAVLVGAAAAVNVVAMLKWCEQSGEIPRSDGEGK